MAARSAARGPRSLIRGRRHYSIMSSLVQLITNVAMLFTPLMWKPYDWFDLPVYIYCGLDLLSVGALLDFKPVRR